MAISKKFRQTLRNKTSCEFPVSVTVLDDNNEEIVPNLVHDTRPHPHNKQTLHHTGAVLAVVRRSRAQRLHHFRRALRPRVAEIGEVPGWSLRLQSRSRRAHASVKNLPDRVVQNKQKIQYTETKHAACKTALPVYCQRGQKNKVLRIT